MGIKKNHQRPIGCCTSMFARLFRNGFDPKRLTLWHMPQALLLQHSRPVLIVITKSNKHRQMKRIWWKLINFSCSLGCSQDVTFSTCFPQTMQNTLTLIANAPCILLSISSMDIIGFISFYQNTQISIVGRIYQYF